LRERAIKFRNDVLGLHTAFAQRAQAQCVVTLSEPLPKIVCHQRTVNERGQRLPKGSQEQDLPKGRGDQVRAAHDLRDAHLSIIDRTRQLVARKIVLPPDQEIAEVTPADSTPLPERAVLEVQLNVV